MIARTRLKRAIDDASQMSGMRTGSPKVTLTYADAHRLYKELEYLQVRLDKEIEDHIEERQRLLCEIAELKGNSLAAAAHCEIDVIDSDISESDTNTDRAIWENNGIWSEPSMYGSGYFVRDSNLYLSYIDVPRAVFVCSKEHFHRRLRHILDKHFMGEE